MIVLQNAEYIERKGKRGEKKERMVSGSNVSYYAQGVRRFKEDIRFVASTSRR